MRQVREILRLKCEQRLPHRAIARDCGVGVGTVGAYCQRAQQAGVTWPLPASGAAVCGAGGVMAWERGRGEGARGAEAVDVDFVDVDFYENGWPCQVAIAFFLVGSVAFGLEP